MQSELTEIIESATEEALIASAKSGDQLAFEALAKAYKRVLEYHIKRYDPPSSIYDDLFQEGLIGLLKAIRSYNGKSSSFGTFASHCVRNAIISGVRKYANQDRQSLSSLPNAEEETSPSAEEVLFDSVRVQQLYNKVYDALSPYEKTVFDMYLLDMPYENIAFVTGKSVKSTSNAVYRIRTKLKQIVGNADIFCTPTP